MNYKFTRLLIAAVSFSLAASVVTAFVSPYLGVLGFAAFIAVLSQMYRRSA